MFLGSIFLLSTYYSFHDKTLLKDKASKNFQTFKEIYLNHLFHISHSSFLSGGLSDNINSLAVSAPYFFIILTGSTIFFLDLDIFQILTLLFSSINSMNILTSIFFDHIFRINPIFFWVLIYFMTNHALAK